MNSQGQHEDRDQVLYAFHLAYERPTAEQIAEWTKKYPQFAEDIRAHAAVSWDLAARAAKPGAVPDETMLALGFSRVLEALYNARKAAGTESAATCESFKQLIQTAGTDVPKLSRTWDIGRSVLTDLVNGRILAPIGKRLVNAFRDFFGINEQGFYAMLARERASPRAGLAKASQPPVVNARSYEDIIRDSDMPQDRKDYWLGEDQ
jgi:hypothetical protein